MPRKPRIDVSGYVYHIIARGNNQTEIFYNRDDYQSYFESIKRARQRFPFYLYAYVLMPNHVHLLIKSLEDGIVARIMQIVQTRHAQHFNRKYARSGHIFQGRYKSILVEEEPHLLELTRYIHRNPIRAGLTNKCIDYPYSSYQFYLQGDGKGVVNIEEILVHFGKRRGAQIKTFLTFVEEERRRKIYRPELYLKGNTILGSDEFQNKIAKLPLKPTGGARH